MSTAILEGSSAVRMVNGRLVSLSLTDPEVRADLTKQLAERRKDPAALRALYIQRGMLSPSGKLAKRFGG